MPLFQYTSLDGYRRERRGAIEAEDIKSAASALRAKGLYVISIGQGNVHATDTKDGISLKEIIGSIRWVGGADLIFFFKQMALMLRSGLTLLQALEVSRRQTTKLRFSRAIHRMTKSVQSGQTFSKAMNEGGPWFPPIVIKLIETAEASGELDMILDRVALYLERKRELKTNMLTSITYPAIVVFVSIGVAIFLIVKVIPKFAKFFQGRQISMPPSTQFLLDLSAFFKAYGLVSAVLVSLAAFGLAAAYTTPRGRHVLDRGFLVVPVVGRLLTVGAMTQVCRTLSMLLRSGVTLIESLRIVPGVVNNRAISHHLEEASGKILAGKDLAGSLEHAVIPHLVPQVVAVGERTGALDHVLEELGEFYDRDLQATIKRMSALVEPVMILIIGGMVGFVYYAFFQAIFKLVAR